MRGVCRAALLPGAASGDGLTADDLQTVRAEVYPSSAANAYAHLRVAEYSDQIAALPPEVHGLLPLTPSPIDDLHLLSFVGWPLSPPALMRRCLLVKPPMPSDERALASGPGSHQASDHVQELRAAMGGGGGGGGPGAQALNMPVEDLVALEQQLREAQERVQQQGGVIDEDTLRAMHPLAALLRTLLPWVNAGEEPEYGSEDDGHDA